MKYALFYMRTWGEMGNSQAASTLADMLAKGLPGAEIAVEAIEDHVPLFARFGERIRDISRNASCAGERAERYMRVMAEVAEAFPPGMESGSSAPAALDGLTAKLERDPCDIAIGTKGVITRVVQAAARACGRSLPTVNFVTNHGLLTLAPHQAVEADLHLVQYVDGVRLLSRDLGVPVERIRLVGPMVSTRRIVERAPQGNRDTASDGTAIVVFANRGGWEYLTIAEHLVRRWPDVEVFFIAYNDEDLAREVSALAAGRHHWRVVAGLSQDEYFAEIRRLQRAARHLLITKAGPNTVMEATVLGLPTLLLESGLPMERWLRGLVEVEGLGVVARDSASLIEEMDALLADPESLRLCALRVKAYAEAQLAVDDLPLRIGAALDHLAKPTGNGLEAILASLGRREEDLVRTPLAREVCDLNDALGAEIVALREEDDGSVAASWDREIVASGLRARRWKLGRILREFGASAEILKERAN